MTDLRPMFDGAVRSVHEFSGLWWFMWFLVAMGLGLFWRMQPGHPKWMRWAWTDYRLLVLEMAGRQRIQVSWLLSAGLAGLAFSLSISGLLAVAAFSTPTWSSVWPWWLMWILALTLRWILSRLWDVHSGDSHHGDVYFLNHRVHMESAAWGMAPFGFVCSTWGPEASDVGLRLVFLIWILSWLLRQHRGISQNPLFGKQPLFGILYLCGLEILPVAVLFRIWQG